MKTALITGSTDGIGRSIAISLAVEGYTIHVLGRNKNRGEEVLKQLNIIFPEGEHKLFLVDLSTVESNKSDTQLSYLIEGMETIHKARMSGSR